MFWTIDKILKGARKAGASDVHLIRGLSPAYRINGEIRLVEGEPLDEATLRVTVDGLLNDRQREIFDHDWQLCFSRHWEGIGRCRAVSICTQASPKWRSVFVRRPSGHERSWGCPPSSTIWRGCPTV